MTEESKEKSLVDFVVGLDRVTKVTKGGKTFSFRALVVSGDQQGNVGIGLGKSRDVSSAIAKATARARKDMINVPLRFNTIPYNVKGSHGATKVIMRSAHKGTGVIAGGPVRAIMRAAGISDVLAKILGSANKQNVVKATLNALSKLRSLYRLQKLRSRTTQELLKGAHAEA